MALENVFSWSKSRDEQFRDCQRKYYYDKYASWGGWDARAPKEARLAYIYKNLKNRWAWKGETVHHIIENSLKALRLGRPISLEEATKELTDAMRRDYKSSKAKKYFDEPKKCMGLFEHEYEKPVTDETWKKIHDESAQCLTNFYHSGFYDELAKDDKKSWLLIEDLEEFYFEGAKVYVKLDFCRKKDNTVEIYDWKTGKTDGKEFNVQMGAYALYAMQKWKIGLSEVRAFIVNVTPSSPAPREETLTEDILLETKAVMQKSISGMKELLLDSSKNIPLDKKEFKYTSNLKLCENCNFYKICEKYA